MANIKLYINNLSGPARGCYWALALNGCLDKVEIHIVDLLKKEQMTEEFLAMNPYHTIPTLRDDSNGLVLYESGAILQYLTEVFGFEKVTIPTAEEDVVVRGKVLNYLHFHHGRTKGVTKAVYGRLRALLFPGTQVDNNAVKDAIDSGKEWLPIFDRMIGENGGYIAGSYPTIADVNAYCEFGVMRTYEYGYDVYNFKKYANITAWFDKMTALPHFEESHEAMKFLVTLSRDLGASSNQDESC